VKPNLYERRSFLGAASAALSAPLLAQGEPLNKKVRTLLAEGALGLDTTIGEQPLNLPPELIAALRAGAQVRARVQYPDRGNLLVFQVFLAAPTDPPPPSPELRDNDPRLFAHMLFEIRDTHLSTFPEMSLGLYGRVLTEIKPSPFFPGLSGRLVALQLGFEQEGDTAVSMLTVTVAGDHVIVARQGRGHLELHP
jgi:hypothetical protein